MLKLAYNNEIMNVLRQYIHRLFEDEIFMKRWGCILPLVRAELFLTTGEDKMYLPLIVIKSTSAAVQTQTWSIESLLKFK